MCQCTQLYTEFQKKKVLSLGQLNNGPQIVSGFLLNQHMCFPMLYHKPSIVLNEFHYHIFTLLSKNIQN